MTTERIRITLGWAGDCKQIQLLKDVHEMWKDPLHNKQICYLGRE